MYIFIYLFILFILCNVVLYLLNNKYHVYFQKIFFGKKIIFLVDSEGEKYLSIINVHPDGMKWCYVYPFAHVGHVLLKDDGTINPKSKSSYIEKWYFK